MKIKVRTVALRQSARFFWYILRLDITKLALLNSQAKIAFSPSRITGGVSAAQGPYLPTSSCRPDADVRYAA